MGWSQGFVDSNIFDITWIDKTDIRHCTTLYVYIYIYVYMSILGET